ncbi:unnamed protein product [Heligmosomoides polygyrus]|uniref:Transmembrane protein n=1 Tax=Heligmosomoides polygyrus TaxID=6339 RepID=A0A183FDI2_HELPZ|nr:unnamed protein product [Heligmosomoides polygyrus]
MFFLDAFLKGLKPQYDDDACDRLNYYYTPMLFVIFSLTLSAKQALLDGAIKAFHSVMVLKVNVNFCLTPPSEAQNFE